MKVDVCLECGAVSAPGMPGGSGFTVPLGCNGKPHGPTQTIEVAPLSLLTGDKVVEAVARHEYGAEFDWDVLRAKPGGERALAVRLNRTRAALQAAQRAMEEEMSDE